MNHSLSNPQISIIMPAYNAAKFIGLAIDSVLAQTYSNWELLIVNDGSNDNTDQIVEQYLQQDQRIKLFNQKNQGVSTARNTGIENAKGIYISFIDSDDSYCPTFLEKLYNKIHQTEYDLVYSGVWHEKEDKIQGAPYPEMNILESYARGIVDYIGFYSTLIKRSFLDKYQIRFNPICSVGEDQEFLIHCGIYAHVGSVPEVLYHYRWNTSSVMSNITPKKVHIDLASRQRSTTLVQQAYQGPHKKMIIRFLESWEDRIVIIFTNLVVQKIKKGQIEQAYTEVQEFGAIPYCWRSKNFKHFKRACILNTKNKIIWQLFWKKK